ncbi:MAG TPA: peptide chain release factor N(5)-glutamine methyltransferase [Bradyrhizobium sp.]|nr:peptide chain release factor N(5)-glutamine methyltransferase [Bradyrhizobium sp.]
MNDTLTGLTIETARRALARRFESASIDSAELDARMLVCCALGLDLTGLITQAARPLTATEATQIEAMAHRRLAGEPVARILGQKEFWGMALTLSAATLVPRPDTETVVELALEMLRAVPILGRKPRIADIGTGSGAILLALLSELPDAYGVGTDISLAALKTARNNAANLGFAKRCAFVACNYAAALRGPFDLIVSNPPYIRSADIAGLAAEVRDYDPHRALDGGADGLAAYRTLIAQAGKILTPNGALVVEVGHDQSGQVERLMTTAGLIHDRPAKADLSGIPRAVAGRKMPL